MTILTEAEYKAVLERIAALSGCAKGTPEERELIELKRVVEVWETRQRLG
jgi:hypothetical protein